MEDVFRAAEKWKAAVGHIEQPWLVWHVSDRWTRLQQRLVQSAGWTPVVGRDPRATMPPLLAGAVFVEFNETLGLPLLFPHIAIEFAWLYVRSKLAFWHADLLCRLETMRKLAEVFERLQPGETAAVFDMRGRRNYFFPRKHRYWELAGCTTVAASRSQYETGTGWWMNFASHPKCPSAAERERRLKYYWDHGAGIQYWKRHCKGRVVDIPLKWVAEGHCTAIGNKSYVHSSGSKKNASLATDLDANYDIEAVAERLQIRHLLD